MLDRRRLEHDLLQPAVLRPELVDTDAALDQQPVERRGVVGAQGRARVARLQLAVQDPALGAGQWRVVLRDGVKFEDGTPITCAGTSSRSVSRSVSSTAAISSVSARRVASMPRRASLNIAFAS